MSINQDLVIDENFKLLFYKFKRALKIVDFVSVF